MKSKKILERLDYLEAHPDRHDQSNWTNIGWDGNIKVKETVDQEINCGTTGCLAGHAGFKYAPVGTKFYSEYMRLVDSTGYTRSMGYKVFAIVEFELTRYEANYLFNQNRTVQQMRKFVKMPKARRQAFLAPRMGYANAEQLACYDSKPGELVGDNWIGAVNIATFFPKKARAGHWTDWHGPTKKAAKK